MRSITMGVYYLLLDSHRSIANVLDLHDNPHNNTRGYLVKLDPNVEKMLRQNLKKLGKTLDELRKEDNNLSSGAGKY